MQAEILIVPTPASLEMLKRSAQLLAKQLVSSGITVYEEISLCPDRKRLQHAISAALSRSDLLFTVGGMGRDSHFLAKNVMSEGLGLPLEHSTDTELAIKEYIQSTGMFYSPDDATLASLPAGSRPLFPTKGILPGCLISSATQHIVMLPENAEEIVPMMEKQVFPYLTRSGGVGISTTHQLRAYGISEDNVRQLIMDYLGGKNPVVTTSELGGEEVVIEVAASAKTASEASGISSSALHTIAERLGDYAYGFDVNSLEEAVIQKMESKGYTLSIAEAGTSGMFINRLNTAPGGHYLLDQILTPEDTESKSVQLGLNARRIRRRGDVSEYTAVNMANAARELGESTVGVGITANIPGHSQGGEALVYVAVCDAQDVYVKKLVVPQDEELSVGVINTAVSRALNMLRIFVDYLPGTYPGSVPLGGALDGKVTVTDKEQYDEYYPEEELEPEPVKNKKKRKKKSRKPKKSKAPKGNSKADKIKKVVLLVAVLVFLGGAGYLGWYGYNSLVAYSLRDNLSEVYDKAGIAGLKALNPDTVGFVSLEGTDMRYPVVQAEDNNFYLRRNFNKKKNQHGVPFLDYKSDAKKPSTNMIVYGHNMRDGQIFGELLNYKDVEYYREHPVIQFESVKKPGDYKVFSVFLTSNDPSHFDDGNVFEYHKYINAASEEEFDQFIKQVRVRSIINAPVDVQPGDELLMLSTCDYDLRDSRFVVAARRVRPGETADVETSAAEKNPQPLYPDIWYRTYSGYTKPDVENWDYTPPKNTQVEPISREESSKEDKETSSESSVESSQEQSSREQSSSSSTDNAASKQAEQSRLAQEQAEASRAAEQSKLAEESKAAEQSKLAEESKKAEESKLAEESKAQEQKAKEDAETKAAEAVATAQRAAEDAASYQRSALNAYSRSEAEGFAESAKNAAGNAENAADTAENAARTADTESAKKAAEQARQYARDARSSANAAVDTAKNKSDDADILDTSAKVSIRSGSNFNEDDTLDIVSRIVQQEMGSSFHPEAIKAQAVATYTYIKQANESGSTPNMSLAGQADTKVKNAVSDVLGEAVYYNGGYAFTPYHATSAGATTNSNAVWGGSYPYLVSVDSSVDKSARGYTSSTSMSSDKVSELIENGLGIEATGDPSSWFTVVSSEAGGYNGQVNVCGESRSKKSGSQITGRLLREQVLNLRSAAFDVNYNSSSDTFTFTTYGYGHGVGLSQTGANSYANQGWNYKQILEHYYSGASVR